MTTVYLVRHAEAEGNLYRRIHGWYDALITENGYRQIKALEERFRDTDVDAVYSSDLFRTRTTAGAVAGPRRLEVRTLSGLREVHMGEWEDRTWGEVRRTQPQLLDAFNANSRDWRAPGGENLEEVGVRVARSLWDIAQAHPEGTVAVFCHGTAIRQAVAQLRGLTWEERCAQGHSDNTAVTCLKMGAGRVEVVFENDNSHLPSQLSTLARQAWWRKEGGMSREDVNLWFRPMDLEGEREAYLEARREAWLTVHGEALPGDGSDFYRQALLEAHRDPWTVCRAMAGEEPVGILQLDAHRCQEEKAGYISFCYLSPDHRGRDLGVQLIGQAVSYFRPLGREYLRLQCAPCNTSAQHFYQKYGFYRVNRPGAGGQTTCLLEKYIGYDRA